MKWLQNYPHGGVRHFALRLFLKLWMLRPHMYGHDWITGPDLRGSVRRCSRLSLLDIQRGCGCLDGKSYLGSSILCVITSWSCAGVLLLVLSLLRRVIFCTALIAFLVEFGLQQPAPTPIGSDVSVKVLHRGSHRDSIRFAVIQHAMDDLLVTCYQLHGMPV